jgi:hydrogenase expression/formation protein HypE
MGVREGLEFETTIESDSAPLADLVGELLSANIEIHCMRDLTRGGLASALNEIASAANVAIKIDEQKIPVREDVRGACELLGLDPLYIANEGRFIAFVPSSDAERTLGIMEAYQEKTACAIGQVREQPAKSVILNSKIGVDRLLEMLSGEQLPRIC